MWSYDAISVSCKDPSQITADDVMGSNIERRLFARNILLDERAGHRDLLREDLGYKRVNWGGGLRESSLVTDILPAISCNLNLSSHPAPSVPRFPSIR